ncbi:TM0106 family RecB-like putative nuclease [Mycolicibacterium smegmatis]|uniref:TM0106 family RecB-like putative nuclease n=1 Tax=Mycolicibacterium smegmatis TaxID=1772 RepID=UPI001EFB813F|nr:TM0106 family RecB-like putative nuclease [Mycolicibacterium smegmatis]MCP2625160.1 TM0106 family RecB-like putative nuclease [Mycolicibacterium smegmatis]ULN33894.1 TM0106 family RecB-like putative nuclease [Mycolicibacterium smegmatis]
MFVTEDGGSGPRVIYSASDLAAAARCEYALLRAFDAQLGRGPAVSSEDELLKRTAQLGGEHEQRHLDELREGSEITVIGRPRYTVPGLTAAAHATLAAVTQRAPVIYQAAMFDGRFAGFADFLILSDGQYRLRDTKLARSVKVEALLQLAAYSETLSAAGVPVAPEVELVLGDGAVATYPVDELLPVYRPRRAALEHLLDAHLASGEPVSWEDTDIRACFRCPECEVQVRAHDDLLLVAGMRTSQRARLIDAGITTVAELAARRDDEPVEGLHPRIAQGLTAQARLQRAPRTGKKPPYEVVDPQPLMSLPNPDRGDLFFDFEGDPLWTDDGVQWGLEYMFGVLGTAPRAGEDFHPLWAHNRREERQALRDFLALVRKRRKRHPHMHVYHYAAYEKTALLRLAGRYGEGEDEVDELLRAGVLVDLYPLVRKSIRVGTENYSLKSLEPLYMGAQLRDGDVTTATDSITQYGLYCTLRAEGRDDEAALVLKEIEDYNLYDCVSTRKLRDWLINRAIECSVPPLGAQPVSRDTTPEPEDQIARTLRRFVGDDERTPQQQAVAMIAAARGYHRREDKPFWWSHFDRLNHPVEEWSDGAGVFVADTAHVEVDWHTPPRARKPQRWVRLTGAMAAGELSREMYALYEPPAPSGLTDDPERRAFGSVQVLEADDASAPTEVLICEREPKEGGTFHQLPFALTPGPPIRTTALQNSIEATAAQIAEGLPRLPGNAVVDILLRRPPRTRSGGPLPHGQAAKHELITAALLDLDSSYLAVHGPPGTGKTFTSAAVIARLVNRHHWRIGVVAQAHAVVENLFRDVIAADVPADAVAKKPHGDNACWTELNEKEYPDFLDQHTGTGCVIGGTAWDFANPVRIPPGSLDLLVVEEAGQYSLANTIAVAPAARNLLLLGDPQQLPQVSQGTHPEPVDTSALGWLVDGHHTLPAELGYFLDCSYRMHPAVCAAVSRLSYDNRLRSVDDVTAARHLDGQEPGVHVLLVDHDGNATDSPEEAQVIVAEIRRLLGAAWTDERGTVPLGQDHVLVVTPYNAQVVTMRRYLDAAGLTDVRVGTVDKFQGQQAPVVFISMVASSVDDVPRGISFLLNRNRLNVAVSRAKYAAVIVRSAALTEYLPSTPAGVVELGAFLALPDALPGALNTV